jgi:hypothetical protein
MSAIEKNRYMREWPIVWAHHHPKLVAPHSAFDEPGENAEQRQCTDDGQRIHNESTHVNRPMMSHALLRET